MNKYVLVVFVPLSHTDIVRKAMGAAGAGKIGDYTYCSFSSRGTGRFKGNENSNPTIGEAGQYESAEEERIEVRLTQDVLHKTIQAIRDVHPYEEVAFDVYPIVDVDGL